jgi:hypothetical protein
MLRSFRALLAATTLVIVAVSPLSAQAGKVTCKDGTKSAGGRGACSSHGGVMTAAMKATAKADAKAAKKADKKAASAKAGTKATKAEKTATKTADATTAATDDHDATGAIAQCKDHTYSHAKSHQGACSRHGGVAKFLDGKK